MFFYFMVIKAFYSNVRLLVQPHCCGWCGFGTQPRDLAPVDTQVKIIMTQDNRLVSKVTSSIVAQS